MADGFVKSAGGFGAPDPEKARKRALGGYKDAASMPSMPAGQPTNRPGLSGKGFSDAEIRALHESAGAPRTSRRSFGVGYGDEE